MVETRIAVEPFAPGHVIFDKALLACYSQNFFVYAAFNALVFYIPLYFQVKLQMTPAQAGAGLIPAAISGVIGTLVGGIILKRIGKFYWLAVLASITAIVGCVPIVVGPSSSERGSLISICVGSIIGFIPIGVTITASLIAICRSQFIDLLIIVLIAPVVSNVSPADQAVASACAFLFRSLGAAVGVSLIGVLIQNVLKMQLRDSFPPQEADQIAQGIAQSLDSIQDLPPLIRATVRECYGKGIQTGFAMCLVLLALSTLSVFWWREKKMSR